MKKWVYALLIFFVIGIPSLSYAQEEDLCYSLDSNAYWGDMYAKFMTSFENNEFEKAISYAFQMHAICDRSPMVNFILASSYRKLGDNDNALIYFRKATDSLDEFSTAPELAERFWDERIKTEVLVGIAKAQESEPVVCQECAEEIEGTVVQDLSALKTEREFYGTLKWTGIGLGIGGLALVGTGIGLSLVDPGFKLSQFFDCSDPSGVCYQKEGQTNTIEGKFNLQRAGYAILGAGAGVLLTGTIMAIIAGVRESKLKKYEVDLAVGSQGFLLSWKF